jgi:hypothetical protein
LVLNPLHAVFGVAGALGNERAAKPMMPRQMRGNVPELGRVILMDEQQMHGGTDEGQPLEAKCVLCPATEGGFNRNQEKAAGGREILWKIFHSPEAPAVAGVGASATPPANEDSA